MTGASGNAAGSRAVFALAALAYTVFVVYGSLVPLDFRPMPWEVARARFAAIPFLDLGIGSRADWVANLLLFIPLVFLWLGALTAGCSRARARVAALLVFPLAVLLSVGIEFTQLFFPPRTVSQNDILAEALGAVLGILAWFIAGGRFSCWLDDWQKTHARAALAERLAWVYFAGVLVYNVLPLDLTISLVEIYHKWRAGNLNAIPFGRLPDLPADAIYELVTDALIWVPLAVLWRVDGTRSAWRVWRMTLLTAVLLEFLQLFVYSRVSDVTDIFTAAIGAALGTLAGGVFARREAAPVSSAPIGGLLPFALAAIWAMGVLTVFWYPFEFRTDGAFLGQRMEFLHRVPFQVYYYGTEYRAITEVLRKTLFFLPLGGLLAWGVARQPWRWRTIAFVGAMLLLVGLPAAVELGQVMLPQKFADTTDWALAWIGGLAGYILVRHVLRAPRRMPAATLSAQTRCEVATGSPQGLRTRHAQWRWHLPLSVALLAACLIGVTGLPGIPYNVRELLRNDARVVAALLLGVTIYWLAIWPVWLARRPVRAPLRWVQLPLGLLIYGVVSFSMLRVAVPDESLYDLVGSPVLDWPRHTELAFRWLALMLIPGSMFYLATQSVRRWRGKRLDWTHFAAVLPVLALAYWGVVAQASTDNLIELMASPHPLAFVLVGAWLFLFAASATMLASPAMPQQRWKRGLAVLIMLPVAALLLKLGLAGDVNKYGEHFSALQFLLSPDRQHYIGETAVWLRYAILHLFGVGALSFLQWPFLQATPRPGAALPHDVH